MVVLFFQAARMAHGGVRSVICRRGLWRRRCSTRPPGKLMVDHHYYTFSSIFFYTNRDALLLNGRFNNLVYGSYAPGAPDVFIDDQQWKNTVARAAALVSGGQQRTSCRASKNWLGASGST